MTIIASIHGRLGRDPDQRTTRSGKPMVIANAAVDCGKPNEEATVWVSLLAFADQADQLARCLKGESVSAFGRMTRSAFTGNDGQPRESWSLMVDGLVTARSARPSGGRKRAAADAMQRPDATGPRDDLDDDLPL